MSRFVAEMTPTVRLPPSPKGLPMAMTQSPTRRTDEFAERHGFERLGRLDLQERKIGLGVVTEDLDHFQLRPVREVDDDLVSAFDHVIVRDDQSRRVDDEVRTRAS